MLLYDHAQLDGDSSELDALKRLALSHDSCATSVDNTEETSPLPILPFPVAMHSNKQSTKDAVSATTITPSVERQIKGELASSEHPVSAKSTKLLLIPGSLSSATKQHSVSMPSHSSTDGGWKHEPTVSGCAMLREAKRRIQSDGGQKSVPLSDVMNVRSTSACAARRSLVSLVPLSSAATIPSCSSGNEQVRIKLEPGLSGLQAGKRKLPMVAGMFQCMYFLLE